MAPLSQAAVKPPEPWAWAFFTYTVAVTAFLLYWNARGGGLVQGW